MMVAAILAGTGVIWEGGKIAVQYATGKTPKTVVQDVKPFDIKVDAEYEIERDTPWLVTATLRQWPSPPSSCRRCSIARRMPKPRPSTCPRARSTIPSSPCALGLRESRQDMEFRHSATTTSRPIGRP